MPLFFIILTHFYLLFPTFLLLLLNKTNEGKIIIFWLFTVVWTSDLAGYFFGKLLKGPKLYPIISPNKTWSGFIAGVFFSGVFSVVFSYFYDFGHYLSYLFFGSVGAIISTVGDFFESKIKRLNNKKDSSNIIPGHGGLLDRLDGFLFAILYFYLLFAFRGFI